MAGHYSVARHFDSGVQTTFWNSPEYPFLNPEVKIDRKWVVLMASVAEPQEAFAAAISENGVLFLRS